MSIVMTDLEGKSKVTLRSGAYWVAKRALIGHDGTGWIQADASAATRAFARFIACEPGKGGDEIRVCKRATFFDSAAPYTALSPLYCSGATPGAVTHTRPAVAKDVVQIVGEAVTTEEARIEIAVPKEYEKFFPRDVYDTTSEPGLGKIDAEYSVAEVAGVETVYVTGHFPPNIVGDIIKAQLLFSSVNASALDLDITGISCYIGQANTGDTGTPIVAGDVEQADADNIIMSMDVAALMDSGFYVPDGVFCLKLDPDAITGALGFIGLRIIGLKV